MRKLNQKRLGGFVIIAAGLETWIGGHAALGQSDFTLSWVNTHINTAGQDVWVLEAQNTSGATGAGSGFIAADVNVTTPGSGTAGALFIDTSADIDGDGIPDANVTDDPGWLAAALGIAPQPAVSESTGTFIGWTGDFNHLLNPIALHVKATSAPGTENGQAMIWVNSQTYVNHTALVSGEPQPIQGTPAIYATGESRAASNSPTGSIDPAFTSGTVHSLELISIGGLNNLSTATPIANVVVPAGTPITAVVEIVGNYTEAPTETYTLTTPAPPPYMMLPSEGASDGFIDGSPFEDSTSDGVISSDPTLANAINQAESVPEPTALSLLAIGGLGLLHRSRPRR